MKITRSRGMSVALVVAAAAVSLPSVARAQFAVDTSGHLNDANARLGSGGYNNGGNLSSRSLYSNLQNLNNNIVTGNVTGLAYFHGPTGTFDPNVFQGNTGTNPSDRLNQIAAPQNLAQRSTGQPLYTPYYNTAAYTAPRPTNFVPTPGGVGLIPAQPGSPLTPNVDSRLGVLSTGNDQLDVLPGYGQDQEGPGGVGQLNNTVNRSIYTTASPLYGVRQTDGSNPDDDFFFARSGDPVNATPDQTSNTGAAYGANAQRLRIEAMRAELGRNILPNDPNGTTNRTDQPNTPGPPANGQPNGGQPTNGQPANGQPAFGQPGAGQPASGQPTNGANGANGGQTSTAQPTPGGLRNLMVQPGVLAPLAVASSAVGTAAVSQTGQGGEGMRYTLVVPPAQQSKQLAELINRFNKGDQNGKVSDQEAIARFNEERRLQNAGVANGIVPAVSNTPGTAPAIGIGSGPIGGFAGRPMNKPAAAPTVAVDPLTITSLSDGVQAPGLAGLFKQAEQQMKDGKYVQAVDTYAEAGQVAPNNPFVPLGRAFAELGASYYGRADGDLTRAILAEPALLVGKYDLRTFLGADRLGFVQKDLADIAASDKGARSLVLLAYISHNGGDDKAAATQLDAAAARGGNADLIAQMRKVWELKAGDATNK